MALEKGQEKIMPVYEYECDICGFVVEEVLKVIPYEPPTHRTGSCRNCGETNATFKKLISHSSFHLKGGKCTWGEGKFSSSSDNPDDVVELNEP